MCENRFENSLLRDKPVRFASVVFLSNSLAPTLNHLCGFTSYTKCLDSPITCLCGQPSDKLLFLEDLPRADFNSNTNIKTSFTDFLDALSDNGNYSVVFFSTNTKQWYKNIFHMLLENTAHSAFFCDLDYLSSLVDKARKSPEPIEQESFVSSCDTYNKYIRTKGLENLAEQEGIKENPQHLKKCEERAWKLLQIGYSLLSKV